MIELLKSVKRLIFNSVYYLINSFRLKLNKATYGHFKINGLIYIHNIGTLSIGNNFSANSGKNKNPIGGDTILRLIVYKKDAKLKIGNQVGISNSTIVCWDSIEIGNNVMIGGSCKIWDTNFHSTNPLFRMSVEDNDVKTSPVYIRDNAFIGANVTILKGVTIGENSIIAAGSVVTKSIPANVIAGGNPCVVIRNLSL